MGEIFLGTLRQTWPLPHILYIYIYNWSIAFKKLYLTPQKLSLSKNYQNENEQQSYTYGGPPFFCFFKIIPFKLINTCYCDTTVSKTSINLKSVANSSMDHKYLRSLNVICDIGWGAGEGLLIPSLHTHTLFN